jgi:endonuclease/exonuclease/phosphatase (EEP) superfamily protein YafD
MDTVSEQAKRDTRVLRGGTTRSGWRKRGLLILAALYPLFLLILSTVNMLGPKRTGLLGLSEVFAPYLFLPLLLLVPLMFVRGAVVLRVLLVLCAVVYVLRFPPKLIIAGPQSTPGATHLSVLSWNTRAGGEYDQVMAVLRSKPAAIVGLVEADWNGLSNDPEVAALYPNRWGVEAAGPVSGEMLLTEYPILEKGILGGADIWGNVPRAIWARLDVGLGKNIVVVVAHPPPGRFCTRYTFPRGCYNTSLRDQQLQGINAAVQPFLKAGDALIMVGDFNVTEREPAYKDLSAGLVDAYHTVGAGTGTTWRPTSLMNQDLALLRIDYQFSSPNIVPLSSRVDCTPRGSDHCIVAGEFEVK